MGLAYHALLLGAYLIVTLLAAAFLPAVSDWRLTRRWRRRAHRTQEMTLWEKVEAWRAPWTGALLSYSVWVVWAESVLVLPFSVAGWLPVITSGLIPSPIGPATVWIVRIAAWGTGLAILAFFLPNADKYLLQGEPYGAPLGWNRAAKSAVADASIASGFGYPPRLMLLPLPGSNAFALKVPGRAPVIGLTEHLSETHDEGEMLAIFANLLARIRYGTAAKATVHGVMLQTLARLNYLLDEEPDGRRAAPLLVVCVISGVMLVLSFLIFPAGNPQPGAVFGQEDAWRFLVTAMAVTCCLSLLFTWLIATLYSRLLREAHTWWAARADADALMWTREPEKMLSALRGCRPMEESVPVSAGAAILFYSWPLLQAPGIQDPELTRIDELNEALPVAEQG